MKRFITRKNLNKGLHKQLLFTFVINCTEIIKNGLQQHEPKRIVINNLRARLMEVSVQLQLDKSIVESCFFELYRWYSIVSKRVFVLRRLYPEKKNIEYEVVKNLLIDSNEIFKLRNRMADRAEFWRKHDLIYGFDGLIKKNRGVTPFFLCSSHKDPAEDHKEYQGKMYYDADWEEYTAEEYKRKIKSYIRNHNLLTVQEACAAPVWLCTRRNCKHYLKAISIEKTLTNSVKKLLKMNNMYMKDVHNMTRAMQMRKRIYEKNKILKALKKTR